MAASEASSPAPGDDTAFHHPHLQPFADQPHKRPVGNAVGQKLPKPVVIDRIEVGAQISVNHVGEPVTDQFVNFLDRILGPTLRPIAVAD